MSRKNTPGDTSKAIGYLRVSTEDQRLGPEAQRAAIEAWANASGVNVIAWHVDQGVSGGADLDARPALMAAIAELRTHGAGVLVVAKRDRLARDTVVAGLIERAAKTCGATVVSADGVGNGDDAASQFMKSVIDAAAEYERALIRGRTRAALAAKKVKRELTGSVPYGYRLDVDGVHLLEDEAEQAVIAWVRGSRAAGMSLRMIARELERQGMLSRNGKVFAATSINRMVAA